MKTVETRRSPTVALALGVITALACRTQTGVCPLTPCPPSFAYFYSPCGFKSVTSTCSGFSGSQTNPIAIGGAAGETCTVTATYGEGTTATTKLTFRAGDECCTGVQLASEAPPLVRPTTCVADAGVDGNLDGNADAASDAPSEATIDP